MPRTSIHRIGDLLANAHLLVGEEAVLVDTGWPGRRDAVAKGLRRAGLRPSDISRIVLTHHHPDHAGNAAALKSEAGAMILAHPADAPFIEGKERPPAGSDFSRAGRMLSRFPRPVLKCSAYPAAAVDGFLEDGSEVEGLPGTLVMHVPGHTPGSVCLHNPGEGWLLAGDAVSHMLGKLWLPTLSFSWDLEGVLDGVRRIISTEVREIHFGHGPPLRGDDACDRLSSFLKKRSRMCLS